MAPSLFLASVSVGALSIGMAAADDISSPQNTQAVFNTDVDHTITATGSVDLTTGAGDAVVITDDYSSTFTNDGTISGPATGDQFGIGLLVDGDLEATGQVVNNGSIDIDVNGSSFLAGTGIYLDGQVAGSFVNTGTITVNSDNSSSGPALAFGVDFDSGVEATATVRNSGVISVKANSGSSSLALATGLFFDNDVDTNITNSGTVNATAENASTLLATGINLTRELNGDINNSGTIQATATENGSVARAIGVRINDEATGNITNSGSVSASADAFTSATAYAVQLESTLTGNFTNTGSLTAISHQVDPGFAPPPLRNPAAAAFIIDETVLGNIENQGSVTVSATVSGSGSLTASGFHLGEDLNGIFLNSGTISVSAGAIDDNVRAYGLYIDNDLNDDFFNSGVITVTASSLTDDAKAYGLYVEDDVDGNVTNSGTVYAKAEHASSATAAGFYIENEYTGNFTNSGSITAIGTEVTSETAESYGLYVGDDMTGDIVNSGTVFARADGFTEATVAGFYLSGAYEGDFTNSGSVTAIGTDQTESAEASGFHVNFDMTGNIVNSGSISVAANGETDAIAVGLDIGGTLTGDFSNSGVITAVSTDVTDDADAYGLYVDEDVTGDIDNSGTISVQSSEASEAYNAGIYIREGYEGDLRNSGAINAVSTSAIDDATARGVYIRGGTEGSVSNSGSISVRAEGVDEARAQAILLYDTVNASVTNTGDLNATVALVNPTSSARAIAAGIYIEDMQSTLTNSGTIAATASGTGADAFGIYIENFDDVISDVGNITATSEGGDAYAIYLDGGNGTLNVDTEDSVTGTMRVVDHDVNLDARGGSNVFIFEDAAPGTGTFTTTVSDDRSVWFVQDEGGANPVYASVTSADVFTSGDVIASFGGLVGSAGQALGYSAPAQVTRGFAFRDGFVNAFRPYALVDVQSKQFEQSGGSDTDVNLLNGSFGFSGQLENGVALAFGVGVFTADGDSDTTSFDTNAVYLNVAAGRQFGAYTVEADLGVGFLSNDKSREITGSPDAKGDYDSTLYTAGLSVERSFNPQGNFDLLGFGSVRYTRQDDDSYTETGSLANATVGEATTEVIEARLGLETEKTLGAGGALIGQLSGVLRRDLGDSSADITVFSNTNSLVFPSTDFTGGSVLVGYEKDFASGLKLEVNAEQEIGDDAQGPFVKAGLKWAF